MAPRDSMGRFEFMVLLAVMRLDSSAYGVLVARELETVIGREVALGRVYFALQRLESRRLVRSRLGEPTAERGGRAKRYFQITGKGLQEVRETSRALTTLWRGLPQMKSHAI